MFIEYFLNFFHLETHVVTRFPSYKPHIRFNRLPLPVTNLLYTPIKKNTIHVTNLSLHGFIAHKYSPHILEQQYDPRRYFLGYVARVLFLASIASSFAAASRLLYLETWISSSTMGKLRLTPLLSN